MKHYPTRYEVAFAKRLDEAQIDYKMQMIFGFYILDFCLPDYLINVEIDGDIHDPNYDFRRDRFSNVCGLKVVRILNEYVENFDMTTILKESKYPASQFRSVLGKANAIKGQMMNH